jgi:hypothetical protein
MRQPLLSMTHLRSFLQSSYGFCAKRTITAHKFETLCMTPEVELFSRLSVLKNRVCCEINWTQV